jgi:hypothetical protein
MDLLDAPVTPAELLVPNARFLRDAEREGRFDDVLQMLNSL